MHCTDFDICCPPDITSTYYACNKIKCLLLFIEHEVPAW